MPNVPMLSNPKMDLQKLTDQCRDELTQQILPFWEKHAFDPVYGGVYEALDERGEIISTDKPVAMQAQAIHAFASAYLHLEENPAWLNRARSTADFLLKNGLDDKGNFYQKLDRLGHPLEASADPLPALHAVLALGALFKATSEVAYAEMAQKTLIKLLRKRDTFLKKQKESPDGGRSLKSLEEFALIGQALLAAKPFTDKKWHRKTLDGYVAELTGDFYDKRSDILLENVTPEGHFWDCPKGRILVPGRIFEVVNLTLDIAHQTRNRKLLNQMLDLAELTIQAAWDEANGEASPGGFFYQMDLKSQPPLDPRWCHKMAWVQLEAMQALFKAHSLSTRSIFLETFEKTHDYVWAHFPDRTNGGWFSELTRENEVFVRHKVLPDNGCFMVVRSLTDPYHIIQNGAREYPRSADGKSPPIRG